MNRREALQRTALVLGYTISAPLAAAVLNGCTAKSELTFTPKLLLPDQARLLSAFAETIIPKTDTPGAIEAGVPGFIEDMVQMVYSPEQQANFMTGLMNLGEEAKTALGKDFPEVSKEEQLSFVKKKNQDLLAAGASSQSEGWWNAGAGSNKPFFLELKELTILGFFTSEPGATQVLQYNQVPGPYKGCVPLADVGKAWAT